MICRLASTSELKQGKLHVVQHGALRLGLFQPRPGTYLALELRCNHQGAPLGPEDVQRGELVCPRHGWTYALESGECIHPKGGAPLRLYRLHRVDQDLYADLPDAGG